MDMSTEKLMTRLHKRSDQLLDNNMAESLSKKDAKRVNKFLHMSYEEQLSSISFGIREVHPYFGELEISRAARQILFKIQTQPHDETSFGLGTPASKPKLSPPRRWRLW
jgi:hypothetical protein